MQEEIAILKFTKPKSYRNNVSWLKRYRDLYWKKWPSVSILLAQQSIRSQRHSATRFDRASGAFSSLVVHLKTTASSPAGVYFRPSQKRVPSSTRTSLDGHGPTIRARSKMFRDGSAVKANKIPLCFAHRASRKYNQGDACYKQ